MILILKIKLQFKFELLLSKHSIKSSPKYSCYTTNTASDGSRMRAVFTKFTYFHVSETHTSLHSNKVNFALCCVFWVGIFD